MCYFPKKTIRLLAMALTVSGAFTTSAFADTSPDLTVANFSSSCREVHLSGSTLMASCQNSEGKFANTSFNLNPVIANHNGQLAWELDPNNNGNYAATTSRCSAVPVNGGNQSSFTILECYTRNARGAADHSRLLLDLYIENQNGKLVLRTEPHYPPCQSNSVVNSVDPLM